jgi:hypothetical protein
MKQGRPAGEAYTSTMRACHEHALIGINMKLHELT